MNTLFYLDQPALARSGPLVASRSLQDAMENIHGLMLYLAWLKAT